MSSLLCQRLTSRAMTYRVRSLASFPRHMVPLLMARGVTKYGMGWLCLLGVEIPNPTGRCLIRCACMLMQLSVRYIRNNENVDRSWSTQETVLDGCKYELGMGMATPSCFPPSPGTDRMRGSLLGVGGLYGASYAGLLFYHLCTIGTFNVAIRLIPKSCVTCSSQCLLPTAHLFALGELGRGSWYGIE